MKRHILIRPAAGQDLDEQAEYLATHQSFDLALKLYHRADETFRLLASQPEMGRLTPYQNRFLEGMRMFPLKGFPNHLVFYRPLRGGIEVVRVLHGARDIELLFESLEE